MLKNTFNLLIEKKKLSYYLSFISLLTNFIDRNVCDRAKLRKRKNRDQSTTTVSTTNTQSKSIFNSPF